MVYKTFQEVQAYVNSLPKVAGGYVRLFRGQNKHYGSITAAAHRGNKIEGKTQWSQYCSLLTHELIAKNTDKPDNFAILFFWVEILAQHYGSGSEFLDVTKSLDVATWFALNSCERVEQHLLSGEQGNPSPNDIITHNEYLSYSPYRENAVLYVLDIPETLNNSLFDRRQAINLSEELFSVFEKATRIKAQEASIIKCDPNINKGDAAEFLACDPIHIAPSCLEGIDKKYTASYLFPSPEIDFWYDHFCKVPYTLVGFTDAGQMVGKRTIPVEFYVNDQPSFLAVQQRVVTRNPFNYYLQNPLVSKEDKAEYDEALPILIDNPVIQTSLFTHIHHWNQSLLWKHADLSVTKDREELNTSILHCSSNTFYEFSPLEYADWQAIVDKTDDAFHIRALWLRIYNSKLIKAIFYIDDYGLEITEANAHESYQTVDIECYFDEEENGIVFNIPEKTFLSRYQPYATAIFTVLTMMGDCRPGVTIKPFPSAIIKHTTTNEFVYTVIATEPSVDLKPRLSVPTSNVDFYGLYHKETKETYHSAGVRLQRCATITINSHLPFGMVDTNEIIAAFIEKYGEIW